MVLITVLVICVSCLALFYAYVKKCYSYWSERNILQADPKFPLGNLQGVATSRHPADITKDIYNKFVGKVPFVGTYFFLSPVVLPLDPELIKNILVRDFEYFHDRGIYYNEKDDPLSAHLFSLEGSKWRNLRAKVTPTFTSGKMKMMFETVAAIAEKMAEHIKEAARIDVKDIMSRYSTDVIGSCAFGIDCNSIINPKSEFREYGRLIFEPPKITPIRLAFQSAYPNFSKFIGARFFAKIATDFFYEATESAVKYRQANNVQRKDFLQLLMDLEEGESGKLSMNEIAAQSFLFFLAGFETSSNTMQFCLYEMALNPEIQERAREEIAKIWNATGGKLTYETMLQLPYTDKCINETLRKYPAIDNIFRNTKRDYLVPGTTHVIEKNTRVALPIYGIHWDPRIYPEPERFDPERFNEENVSKRHPFTFLPFGEGPRICIGLRFGLMQTRLGLASILMRYRVKRCDETQSKITLNVSSPIVSSDRPIILQIEKLH